VAQLLDLFAFLSVLLRAMTLAFEALTIGGVIFLLVIAQKAFGSEGDSRLLRFCIFFSALLAFTQILFVGANSVILMNSTGLSWTGVIGANYCTASAFIIAGSAFVAAFAKSRHKKFAWPAGCILILCGTVMTSHSASRLEYREVLVFLTLLHHAAGAAWIGGLPYLLLTLHRARSQEIAQSVTSRFSRMAIPAVTVLVAAGASMSFFYVGTPGALIGTTYGVMLSAKVILTALILALGLLNLRIVRAVRAGAFRSLFPLTRFAEVEVGIGLTILLMAASLTSSPPAHDVTAGRVTFPEIVERMKPEWPRLVTPALADLTPATPLAVSNSTTDPRSFVPGERTQPTTPADAAWSEYNHHWAGLIVFAAGALALLQRRIKWARHWPLVFLGLAAFLFLRADAENWPLGQRGFWESFQVAEVAQHRLFVLLIVAFGVFEWAVRTGRISQQPGGLVFPLVCAIGGALLLAHSHSLSNVKEAFLTELTHTPLAILAVVAGWSRWLEIRLLPERKPALAWIWPVCFLSIGAILLTYREI
jgi:putative copper resistance protein D